MLTESDLFFLNLCNEYRDLRQAKASFGISEEWLKQKEKEKATTAVKRRRRRSVEDSDDDATVPEATSCAAGKPSKKRLINSGIAVVAHEQALPSKQSRNATISGDSEKVCDKEPTDVQTMCHYGGLEDEDDNEEWEAIKQSPVKERGVRISDHVCCPSCLCIPLSIPC